MQQRFFTIIHLLFLFNIQSLLARAVNEGENIWNLQRQTAQSVFDKYITQQDINTGNFTITTQGSYGLAENVSFTAGTAITIATNNVTLDLKQHTISGISTGTAIAVTAGANLQQVVIKNGFIQSAGLGVFVNQLSQGAIDSIIISQSNGVQLLNCGLVTVNECNVGGPPSSFGFSVQFTSPLQGNPVFTNCIVDGCSNGFISSNASADVTKSITILDAQCTNCASGYSLNSNAFLENCSISRSTVAGFQQTGFIVVFKDCMSFFGAVGFFIRGTGFLTNCIVTNHTSQGFIIGTAVNDAIFTTVDNCLSQNNQNGFLINSSFTLIKSSIAANNITNGFIYGSMAIITAFTNNIAYGNGVNNFLNAPATSLVATNLVTGTSSIQALDATYWWNVVPV